MKWISRRMVMLPEAQTNLEGGRLPAPDVGCTKVRKMEKQRNMDEQNWKVFGVDSGCPDCLGFVGICLCLLIVY